MSAVLFCFKLNHALNSNSYKNTEIKFILNHKVHITNLYPLQIPVQIGRTVKQQCQPQTEIGKKEQLLIKTQREREREKERERK